jgi:amino acid transporter
MLFKQLFAKKSLEMLKAEAEGDNRLRRVLGPVALTSLGVGAIIGAGIFVMTGRVAADDAGPAIVVSFIVAGIGCALAAFCYAEFASMAPVAGSAYTYAYATLGELFAWIIGWDLVLEYAMSCATVGASWSKYLNELLRILVGWEVPEFLCHDPFSLPGAWLNLPAVLILGLVTVILVIGIRESAASNTVLVLVKLGVIFFVIAIGAGYVSTKNWFDIRPEERKTAEQIEISNVANELAKAENSALNSARDIAKLFDRSARDVAIRMVKEEKGQPSKPFTEKYTVPEKSDLKRRGDILREHALAVYIRQRTTAIIDTLKARDKITEEQAAQLRNRAEGYVDRRLDALAEKYAKEGGAALKQIDPEQKARADVVIAAARERGEKEAAKKWGLLGHFGINKWLTSIDDAVRGNYFPYGLSGMMVGAALVFFAFIGFDSISTHSEEARNPQRDVPIGILASLFLCTLLYIAVSAVITGMLPYPEIDTNAAIASAFRLRGEEAAKAAGGESGLLKASAGLIAAGGLAGMTSVLLITFLSQARIFLAMARDHLLPPTVFGAVHAKFRTPHLSTMLTGGIIMVVAAFTDILILEEMVNIGTLFAFVVVCAAVLILRLKRPDAERPFRCPGVFIVAPLGILVNFIMMLFLTPDSWLRLVVWMAIGLVIYFLYGVRHSSLGKQLRGGGVPIHQTNGPALTPGPIDSTAVATRPE